MSLLGKVLGTDQAADKQSKAATQAAQIQADATTKAAELSRQTTQDVIASQEQAAATARSDLQPFRDAGAAQLPNLNTDLQGIRGLVTDLNQQASFVQDNPFFKALADDAQRRIFNNQAAKGKVGSGGTAEALQNSIMLLGNDLVNQNVSQRQGVLSSGLNIASLGSNAAAGQANITQGAATNAGNTAISGNRSITDLLTQGANAQASGVVGSANAQAAGTQAAINTALQIGTIAALSDKRYKENIKPVGKSKGVPYYFFKYKDSLKLQFGTMAHEVEHIKDAVIDIGGKKYVNYGAL